jgi:hypothetical protein
VSKFFRKETTHVFTIEACARFRTLSVVGPRFYWENSSCFKWSAQVDLDFHELLYQVDKDIPTRSSSYKVIIGFLEDIMERFGCPNRIVTDYAASFKDEPLIQFCEQFIIALIHSTPYYPRGNRLAESSNKSLIKIIKILL